MEQRWEKAANKLAGRLRRKLVSAFSEEAHAHHPEPHHMPPASAIIYSNSAFLVRSFVAQMKARGVDVTAADVADVESKVEAAPTPEASATPLDVVDHLMSGAVYADVAFGGRRSSTTILTDVVYGSKASLEAALHAKPGEYNDIQLAHRGGILLFKGQTLHAKRWTEAALKAMPKADDDAHAEALSTIAACLMRMGRSEEGLKFMKQHNMLNLAGLTAFWQFDAMLRTGRFEAARTTQGWKQFLGMVTADDAHLEVGHTIFCAVFAALQFYIGCFEMLCVQAAGIDSHALLSKMDTFERFILGQRAELPAKITKNVNFDPLSSGYNEARPHPPSLHLALS